MKKAYIYPHSSRNSNTVIYNPYIDDFGRSCGKYFQFVNYTNPSRVGIFQIFKYLTKIDFIFFNWIEKLPELKGGKIQALVLILLLPILKVSRIKIVWTMHNKLSHSHEYIFWKKIIFKAMLKYADEIITHSTEGIVYAQQKKPGSEKKVNYFPHPVKDRRANKQYENKYDILIWGTISPYKGIDKYLNYLIQNNLTDKYKTYIVGKSTSEEYFQKLVNFSSKKITIENKFISDENLQQLIAESRLVLFTYSKSSILSSGVLMDSLGYGANIIGPQVGAFSDLAKDGILTTYSTFEELIPVIEKNLNGTESSLEKDKLNIFLKDNTWDNLAKKISKIIT